MGIIYFDHISILSKMESYVVTVLRVSQNKETYFVR